MWKEILLRSPSCISTASPGTSEDRQCGHAQVLPHENPATLLPKPLFFPSTHFSIPKAITLPGAMENISPPIRPVEGLTGSPILLLGAQGMSMLSGAQAEPASSRY